MITAYLLIAAFAMGWLFGADRMIKNKKKFTFWESVAVAALCLAWPYLLLVLAFARKGARP